MSQRVYVRIESNDGKGKPSPGEEAACLRVAGTIASALNLGAPKSRRARSGALKGVTLRLDVEG